MFVFLRVLNKEQKNVQKILHDCIQHFFEQYVQKIKKVNYLSIIDKS